MAARAEDPGASGWIYTVHFDRPLGTSGRNSASHPERQKETDATPEREAG